ncbi:hypothetical protein Tco_1041639 [Tanacetum coccineum]|uniref:Retrotransposon gag domain-containing protein n=1 Tax=Tanacetum coccineum TaxID=301880 RepID=A0ABQ5GIB8_9ASTR
MTNPSFLDHLVASPEHAPVLSDHVVDFPEDDLAVEIEEVHEEYQDMDIDEEDPEEDQIMNFKVDDEVEEFQYSIYEVGGLSSVVPESSHLGGHPLSIVASRDALHHEELVALHVRLDGVESIQTDLRRSERAIVRHVGWLGERDEVIQHRTLSLVRRVQTLVEDGDYVQDVLDVVDTVIAELRDVVDDYPCGQGIHLDMRAENQDLRTRLSASENSERCMITCLLRMEERISALEQRSPGPQGLSNGSTRAGDAGPAVAGGNARGARENAGGNTRGNVAPEVRGCTYKKKLGCNPLTFGGTEGVVGLSGWIEKLSSVFQISKCTNKDKVKYGACTLQGRALTWWNGYVHSLGIDAVNQIPLTEFKQIMTDEYCPRNKLQRMEQELWDLTVKGDDIAGYTNRNVTSSKPATAHEAIHMAHILMDQPVRFKVARSGEANKRKWEDYQSGGNNNNNNLNNTHHHQQNQRQEAAKAYVVALAGEKFILGVYHYATDASCITSDSAQLSERNAKD